MHLGKGNCGISPRLPDTDSDGPPVSVGFDGSQLIDGIAAKVRITVGPFGS